MKKIILVLVVLLFLVVEQGCCKKTEQPGKATMILRLRHHGEVIPNHLSYPDTIWIKYNAKEAPATLADYDKIVVGSGTEEFFKLSNVNCGDYFIYGAGLDSSAASSERVAGGQYVKIAHKDRKKESEYSIAVTE